jgi:hypothetical protein
LFQVYSAPGWGSVTYVRIGSGAETPKTGLEVKAIALPKPGEEFCGDGFWVKRKGRETLVFLGDGLGHGPMASQAVQCAIEGLQVCTESEPSEIIRFLHRHVKSTRGLVGAVAVLNSVRKVWRFCGVGNIATRLYQGGGYKNCVPYNGTIGLYIPGTLMNTEHPAENNQLLVMCSDGIGSRWDLSKYPTASKYDLSVLAAILQKDYCKHNDDSTVLAGKVNLPL